MNILPVRQAERCEMRRLGMIAVKAILGNSMNRPARRKAARIYGAAAYRQYYGLTGHDHRYPHIQAHPDVLNWIVKEIEGKVQSV